MSGVPEKLPIAIYGAGGFGLEVAMLIGQINAVTPRWNIIGFFDDGMPNGTRINDWQVIGGMDVLNGWPDELYVALALGMPRVKRAVVHKIHNERIHFPVLMHPSVICGDERFVRIGQGAIICAGTILTTNIDIGQFVTLNLSCTVGHQAFIGDFCSFMPTCNISGEVVVGEASFFGTGARTINRVHIGAGTTIGAGAVVINDIPDDVTAVGVPAGLIRKPRLTAGMPL